MEVTNTTGYTETPSGILLLCLCGRDFSSRIRFQNKSVIILGQSTNNDPVNNNIQKHTPISSAIYRTKPKLQWLSTLDTDLCHQRYENKKKRINKLTGCLVHKLSSKISVSLFKKSSWNYFWRSSRDQWRRTNLWVTNTGSKDRNELPSSSIHNFYAENPSRNICKCLI